MTTDGATTGGPRVSTLDRLRQFGGGGTPVADRSSGPVYRGSVFSGEFVGDGAVRGEQRSLPTRDGTLHNIIITLFFVRYRLKNAITAIFFSISSNSN